MDLRTHTFTKLFIKNLTIWTSCWSVFTDTLACYIVKFLSISALWPWLRALTLACIWIKFLSTRASDDIGAATFANITIENLSVGASIWLIWTYALTGNFVKFLSTSALGYWSWAFTLTCIHVKSLSARAFYYPRAATPANIIIENL